MCTSANHETDAKCKQTARITTKLKKNIALSILKLNIYFSDWLKENKLPQSFEDKSKEDMAELLRKFYGTVLSRNGKEYSKSGMINIRSGLNRHLVNPPHKKTIDIMQDKIFLQCNKVFTGRLRDNKEKGLDISQPREAIEKDDVEKLFQTYFLPGIKSGDTEVLLHKTLFDILYYTGRRGKEGLRHLTKSSFKIKTASDGVEYIQMTFNEKTKKNQGDATSAAVNALHNDRNIISAQDTELCPVKSFKQYKALLNPETEAFFQYPSDDKRKFTAKVVGKNPLGNMMTEISKKAKLSRVYTNHAVRKTTATAMKRSGFSLEEIANVTKHKNIECLKHYLAAPTHAEKEKYSNALLNYGNKENQKKILPRPQEDANDYEPPKKTPRQDEEAPKQEFLAKESVSDNALVPLLNEDSDSNASLNVTPKQNSNHPNVVNNQLRQASHLFQNATFQNCQFSFNLPN